MTYPHGRARVDATSPRAFAICDRCARLYNHKDLHWQYDFRGRSLANLRILVCHTCEDTPQPQLKPRIIPPDPLPIQNARPERYRQYETNTRYTSGQNTVDPVTGIPIVGGDVRITENNNDRVTQQTGQPSPGINIYPGTLFAVPGNDDPQAGGDYGQGVPLYTNKNIGLPYGVESSPYSGLLSGVTYTAWSNDPENPIYWSGEDGSIFTWSGEQQ